MDQKGLTESADGDWLDALREEFDDELARLDARLKETRDDGERGSLVRRKESLRREFESRSHTAVALPADRLRTADETADDER